MPEGVGVRIVAAGRSFGFESYGVSCPELFS
jgi:hypothetical protein